MRDKTIRPEMPLSNSSGKLQPGHFIGLSDSAGQGHCDILTDSPMLPQGKVDLK
ncbi:hypothetical protein [Agrobacterium vitis]|uniref:hypothetical protein n=1 Tax=Agrobacterium vitis TaxID=373 RepID=UPI0012EA9D8E|nr:hypothetical protein [Agrobacterium vitis]MCM2449342.1 hypothetical protein [Agrobacterium vitis]MCM2468213.1 hypothetical protein [Agrobacterium vitis]